MGSNAIVRRMGGGELVAFPCSLCIYQLDMKRKSFILSRERLKAN